MDKTKIYGLLNEDREIVFISDCQSVDWDPDYFIEEDADWKLIKLGNNIYNDDIDEIYWERNVVILEILNTSNEEEIKQALNKWIDMIKPKYILDYINPADLMTFRIEKEKEWEEEDRKWLDIENMDAIDCNM